MVSVPSGTYWTPSTLTLSTGSMDTVGMPTSPGAGVGVAVGTGVGVGAAVGVGVGVPLRANCRCAQRALSTVPFLGMAPTEMV